MEPKDLISQIIKEKQERLNQERRLVKKKETKTSAISIITSLSLVIGVVIGLARIILEIFF